MAKSSVRTDSITKLQVPLGLDVGGSSAEDNWLQWYKALKQLQSSEVSVHKSDDETNPLTGVEVITL